MNKRSDDNREDQDYAVNMSEKPHFRRSLLSCFAILVSLILFTQTVIATGEDHGTAGHGPDVLHILIESLQLLVGIIAVGTAIAGTQTMRGGHMEWAFYSLTAGVVTFLLQRMWHSANEFGLVMSLPSTVEQLLFLTATGLMGLGFLQIYRIMR